MGSTLARKGQLKSKWKTTDQARLLERVLMKTTAKLISDAKNTLSGMTAKFILRDCHYCGDEFKVPVDPRAHYKHICKKCFSMRAATTARDAVAKRQFRWLELCPSEYQRIDIVRLPNPGIFDRIMQWEFGPRGLLLYGDTGRGKTRCAWALLEREFFAGRSAAALDSMAGIHHAAKYSESAKMAESWLLKFITADILLLDDVFKSKLTDSFESTIFSLVDQRIQHQRPIILTSNDTGDTLLERFSRDRANSLLRRLREHCQQIAFE
jgi:predicted ATPase